MEKKIARPISLLKEDFINGVVTLINDSEMPLLVVEYILRDVLNEVHLTVMKQADAEKAEYARRVEDEEKSDGAENGE